MPQKKKRESRDASIVSKKKPCNKWQISFPRLCYAWMALPPERVAAPKLAGVCVSSRYVFLVGSRSGSGGNSLGKSQPIWALNSTDFKPGFYLRRSRQVIEQWELLLLGGTTLRSWPWKPRSTFFGRGQLHFFSFCFPTLNFLRGGIPGSLTRFLFGVGSAAS